MTIRPQSLKDFIGQKEAVGILNIAISSARQRNESLPHVIIEGPPGVGKTSTVKAIANDLSVPLQEANGAALSGIKSLLPYIMKMEDLGPNSILFIDEIHRIPTKVCEFLYPVMEDFKVCLGGESEVMEMDLPSFTLIGATTEAGSLSQPLYDRFKYKVPLKYYEQLDMELIIKGLAAKLEVSLDSNGISRLASVSRGTPRVAVNYTEWIRDYCLSENIGTASSNVVNDALTYLGVDEEGLTEEDRKYLAELKRQEKYNNGPVGLKPLAISLGISEETIAHKIEPYLIRQRKMYRGRKGRQSITIKV